MAMTRDELQALLDQVDLRYQVLEEQDALMVGFVIDEDSTYRDADGDPCVPIILRLTEDGELFSAFAPVAWVLEDQANQPAVAETLVQIQSIVKLVRFDWPERKTIVPNIEIPVEEGGLAAGQVYRVLGSILQVVKGYDAAVRRAISDGIVAVSRLGDRSMPRLDADSVANEPGFIDEADHLNGPVSESLDRLFGGDEGPAGGPLRP